MKKFLVLAIVIVSVICLSSCATLLSEDYTKVTIHSDPVGATIYANGMEKGKTPATVMLHNDQSYHITLKKEGYKDAQATLTRKIKGGYQVLDFLVTGLIGNVVDLFNDAGYQLKPDQLSLTLVEDK